MSRATYDAIPVEVRSGADFVEFALPSETAQPATCYIVHIDVDQDTARCTCKDYEIRRVERQETCKHAGRCFADENAGRRIWNTREAFRTNKRSHQRVRPMAPTQRNGGAAA